MAMEKAWIWVCRPVIQVANEMKQNALSKQSDHESMVLFTDVHKVLSLTKSFSSFAFSNSPKSHRVPHSRSNICINSSLSRMPVLQIPTGSCS